MILIQKVVAICSQKEQKIFSPKSHQDFSKIFCYTLYITGDDVNNMYKFNTNALSFVSLNPTNNGPNTISAYYYTCHLLNDKETIVYIGNPLTQVLL